MGAMDSAANCVGFDLEHPEAILPELSDIADDFVQAPVSDIDAQQLLAM